MSRITAGIACVFTALIGTIASADIQKGLDALNEGKIPEAAKEFQESFDAGEPDGAFYIGRLFELGIGTQKDINRAAQLYAVAVDRESVPAMNRLGLMHMDGQIILRDYARGAELICKAADAGDANAQFNCGTLYQEGKGVVQDLAKALSYWELAANQGHIAAVNFTGQAYLNGDGVVADASKAFELFKQTGDKGNPMGLFEVAKLFADGVGVEADIVQAYAYANLAAVRQHPEAATLRDALESKMSSGEILSAQEVAKNWKAEEAPSED